MSEVPNMANPSGFIETPPWRAEDISVHWLNDVLGNHGDFRRAKISSFDMDMISEGYGFSVRGLAYQTQL